MSLALTITLIVLAIIILTVGGLAGWYIFYRLRKPQIFLISAPWDVVKKEKGIPYNDERGNELAAYFKGRLIKKAELAEATNDGLNVHAAGYVTDPIGTSSACSGNPVAYFPDVVDGKPALGTACSRGYWIYGQKPLKMNATIPKTQYTVQQWSNTRWNRYEALTLREFWDALTGKA